MKRVFVLLLTIGLVVAMVGAGFAAWVADSEASTGNSFAAGTLDLKVNGVDDPAVAHFTFDNVAPGDGYAPGGDSVLSSGPGAMCQVWTLNNDGTIAGQPWAEFGNVQNNDNGCNEPEGLVDGSCGAGGGDLGDYLHVRIHAMQGFGKKLNHWDGYTMGRDGIDPAFKWPVLQPGTSMNFTLCAGVPGPTTGNIIQSDSAAFDITFHLDQVQP